MNKFFQKASSLFVRHRFELVVLLALLFSRCSSTCGLRPPFAKSSRKSCGYLIDFSISHRHLRLSQQYVQAVETFYGGTMNVVSQIFGVTIGAEYGKDTAPFPRQANHAELRRHMANSRIDMS